VIKISVRIEKRGGEKNKKEKKEKRKEKREKRKEKNTKVLGSQGVFVSPGLGEDASAKLLSAAELLELAVCLLGKLPGRNNDKCPEARFLGGPEVMQDGKQESHGFSRARGSNAKDLAFFHYKRECLHLNGGWLHISRSPQALDQKWPKLESGGHVGR